MNVRFLTPAEKELDDAFEYYQTVMDGLGFRFINEVSRTLSRIQEFPSAYQEIGRYSRRCLVHKFPYALIYQHRETEILIVAVSHLHRKPDYWFSRER
jgi:plasmid stabilization system protein ParE